MHRYCYFSVAVFSLRNILKFFLLQTMIKYIEYLYIYRTNEPCLLSVQNLCFELEPRKFCWTDIVSAYAKNLIFVGEILNLK